LVSEYKLFKRSNKANLFIALVQYPVSQMKMTFQEIRIIATAPCIANQLRDVNTICLANTIFNNISVILSDGDGNRRKPHTSRGIRSHTLMFIFP
jgi:hypothetical protein